MRSTVRGMRIEQIDDLAVAKEVARMLEKEIERLQAKLEDLTRQLLALRGQDGVRQLELEIMKLREQNALLRARLFARSSEKRAGEGGQNGEQKKPRRGHGPREQPELPVETQAHDFEREEDLVCKLCGGRLVKWEGQFEESDEITVVERRFVILRHQRQKARCKCYATVATAPGPLKLIPGGRYSIAFAVEVAVAKYLDHLPLERQVHIMKREGLEIDSQTLWDQIDALAKHLEPTYNALRDYIRAKPLLHADETPWYLIGKKPTQKWYVWCVAVDDAAYYWIRYGRSADEAGEVLRSYRGIVVVDGYETYGTLAREKNSGLVLAFCWAHVRRKIRDASKFYPEECKLALDLISDLYDVERQIPTLKNLDEKGRAEVLELRARLRNEHSRKIVDDIKAWAQAQAALPGSALRTAIDYMLELWPGLIRFLDNPLIVLDNNLVERGLRGPVVGRKNHYGSRSERGTQVAALFYSVLQTAKLAGVEPKAYLLHAAMTAIRRPGSSVPPHELLAQSAA